MGKDGGKEGRGMEELCRERRALTSSRLGKSKGMMHIVKKRGKTEKSMDKEIMQDHEEEVTERKKDPRWSRC